jgi:hypothetical protein
VHLAVTVHPPIDPDRRWEGILFYLEKMHNVDKSGIAVQNSRAYAHWRSWDFHTMRVRLTDYIIRPADRMSWRLEGSLDGESWVEVDRRGVGKVVHKDLQFEVSKPMECRFIRFARTNEERYYRRLPNGDFDVEGAFETCRRGVHDTYKLTTIEMDQQREQTRIWEDFVWFFSSVAIEFFGNLSESTGVA